jgi:hypothetical protein
VPASSLIACLVVLTASLIATIMISAEERAGPLIVATAIAAVVWVLLAIRDRRSLAASGASPSRIAAATARYMGIVWLWGAVSLFIVYVFILTWHEWWQFFAAFAVVGALCLGYASLLERDANAGRDDETMLALGRYMAIGQLIGMVVTVIGLGIDPDKEFYWPADGDWAGNIIFLFGALALLAITAHALLNDKKLDSGTKG